MDKKFINFVALSVQSKPKETLIDYGETVALLPISERVRERDKYVYFTFK